MKALYPAKIEKDESGMLFVRFPHLDEAITEGKTLEEALFNAQEVLTLTLESRLLEDRGIPAPEEIAGKGVYYIAPAARVQSALLIHRSRGDRSLAELARFLGTSWPAARRLENPRHSPTLKILEKAATSLGKKLVISFE